MLCIPLYYFITQIYLNLHSHFHMFYRVVKQVSMDCQTLTVMNKILKRYLLWILLTPLSLTNPIGDSQGVRLSTIFSSETIQILTYVKFRFLCPYSITINWILEWYLLKNDLFAIWFVYFFVNLRKFAYCAKKIRKFKKKY